jgi:hypothetical protein
MQRHITPVAAPVHLSSQGDSCVAGRPARLFWCCGCRAQVLICSRCDRGQIYCLDGCAGEARRRAQRAAGRRYQKSYRGRVKHAVRARRYRFRKKIVTHQGSPRQPPAGLLASSPVAATGEGALTKPLSAPRSPWRCHCCGIRCAQFVRQGFLTRRRAPRTAVAPKRGGHSYDHPS